MLVELTNELKNSNNTIINKLFPFSSLKLYQKFTKEELDNLFLKLIKKLNVDYLIECGAHEATASLSFVKSGGKAIAIEANPYVYRDITPKSFDRFTSINMGLSDKEEVLFFYSPKDKIKIGQSTFIPKKEGVRYDKIEVNTIQLDKLVNNHLKKNESLSLWIDVEGYQKEVLQGSVFSLTKCKLIKIEVEDSELFTNQKWLSSEIKEFLINKNFVPIFRDFEGSFNTKINQYNIIYCSKDFLSETKALVNSSKENLKNHQISLKNILLILNKKRNLLSELKLLTINLFGAKIVHFILKLTSNNKVQ